jgi:nitrogen regulatory protein PII
MSSNLKLIVTIVNRGFAEAVIEASREMGARGGTIIRGKGSSTAIKYFNDFVLEPEKELVWIIATPENASGISYHIYQKVGLAAKGAGISFILPIENLVGIDLQSHILQNREDLGNQNIVIAPADEKETTSVKEETPKA